MTADAARVVAASEPGLDYARPEAVARLVERLLADLAPGEPLAGAVRPGQTVLIKPNFVLDQHPRGGDLQALVTNGAVLRAVLRVVAHALAGRGRIVVADSPLQTTDFAGVIERTGARAAVEEMRVATGLPIALVDLRQVVSERDERGHIARWREVPGDPAGYVTYDLGGDSLLAALGDDGGAFRVSNYQAGDTRQYHSECSHRYVIARSAIDADVIISLPKLKTHCKVGVTLGLKNFVGVVGRKQCLAHHREGGARQGGDEYPGRSALKHWSERLEGRIDGAPPGPGRELLKLLYRVNERVIRTLGLNPIRDGGWHGNDTCWRMTLDLVRIARYGRPDGTMADTPQRAILTLIDGLVAGEGEGPLEAVARPAGVLFAGWDPVQVDRAAARFMGFEPDRIPLLRDALALSRWPLSGPATPVLCFDGETLAPGALAGRRVGPPFVPPAGWVGHMESDRAGT